MASASSPRKLAYEERKPRLYGGPRSSSQRSSSIASRNFARIFVTRSTSLRSIPRSLRASRSSCPMVAAISSRMVALPGSPREAQLEARRLVDRPGIARAEERREIVVADALSRRGQLFVDALRVGGAVAGADHADRRWAGRAVGETRQGVGEGGIVGVVDDERVGADLVDVSDLEAAVRGPDHP